MELDHEGEGEGGGEPMSEAGPDYLLSGPAAAEAGMWLTVSCGR
jgi:hypothetical protein